jgi:branched-chain amino acid transport system ATP-binding protein
VLELAGVSVHYGRVRALSEVSLEVRPGELVTLVGANGAGKTTTLKAISGLLRPSAGHIRFEGERLDRLPSHRIVALGIAHVPEGRQLFPEMTVLEHLELGALRARAGSRPFAERLAAMLDLFPILGERRTQLAGTLSGGQQQMLAIARGLMSAPKVLMLDEPSLGLAPLVVETVAGVIRDLHASGLTVLLVEQNVHLALELADRGYVLETGRVLLEDRAAALLENAQVKRAYMGL